MDISELLTKHFLLDELRELYKDLLSMDSINEISKTVTSLVEKKFNAKISNCLFSEISVGCVFGFELENSEKIVIKFFPKSFLEKHLIEMRNIQNYFQTNGFPCPKCLSGIERIGQINYCFDQYMAGEIEDGHNDKIIAELAKYLAMFVKLSEKTSLPFDFPSFKLANNKIWPEASNIKFKLDAGRGANWITSKARNARKIINQSNLPRIIGHSDWGVKNSRFRNKELVAVFDWDSLRAMSEAEIVGNSCAQFTAIWDINTKITPDKNESRKFIRAYEKFRGKNFNQEEYQVISASAEILVTYIARIEHKFNKITDKEKTPYKYLVQTCGDKFFLELNDLI